MWGASAVLAGVYLMLPGGEESSLVDAPSSNLEPSVDTPKLEVVRVSPADVAPGGAVIVSYVGAENNERLRVFAGADEMPVLDRRPGSLVARLPPAMGPGNVKVRVVAEGERSNAFAVHIKPVNWRKPFRSLIGGVALLVFGIGVFARGVREAVGLRSAHRLARLAGSSPAAMLFGTLVGALLQSTTAAAGFLAGLVSSSLLAVGPAAAAFVGAQLGAATAPLLVTGLIDPHGAGLLAVAIGVLWIVLAADRLGKSIGRLILGAGFIAFGLQSLRPGLEPFVSDPAFLAVADRLNAHTLGGAVSCALLGAALVAAFQGSAPVLVIVVGFAQTTGHGDLPTSLSMLAGSGLGAAVGALLTLPAGPRGRRLAQVHLLLGAAGTLLALATVPIWSSLSDRLVAGAPDEVQWGKRLLLRNFGQHVGVAFALSQVTVALVLLPLAAWISRVLEHRFPDVSLEKDALPDVPDSTGAVRTGLLHVLQSQRESLEPLAELVVKGQRSAGRDAEHRLADAHAALEMLLSGPVRALPGVRESARLTRAAFASLQLGRSLEGLLRQAERLTNGRLEDSAGLPDIPPLPGEDEATLRDMQLLFAEGLEALAASLQTQAPVDLESARAREIRMNGFEARARDALLTDDRAAAAVKRRLGLLELVDAYETAGNQLYRLAEALGDSYHPPGLARTVGA